MSIFSNDYHSDNRAPNLPGHLTVGKKHINILIFKRKLRNYYYFCLKYF